MSPAVISPPRNRRVSRMWRRCSWASAAKTDSRSASRCSASDSSDLDLLDVRELHPGAALAHRLPDRRHLGQRVGAAGGLGVRPREGLDVEDAALLVDATEDEVRRLVGDQAELLEGGPVPLQQGPELAFLFGLHPVATERDVG